jgi:hypothetical protein
MGGWADPRADLGAVEKKNDAFPVPDRESNPGRPSRSLVSIVTKLLTNHVDTAAVTDRICRLRLRCLEHLQASLKYYSVIYGGPDVHLA